MAKVFDRLEEPHLAFIAAQKMFFVATAPRADEGRVNLSPKGYESLKVLDDDNLMWVDLGGSGVETIAHLRENGRITIMYCAFEGAANILRIYGRGQVIDFDHPAFDEAMSHFPGFDRARAIIKVAIDRVSDSCGWGVPFYAFQGERDQLKRWSENRPVAEWKERRYDANAQSIDGLEGLTRPGRGKSGRSQ